MLLGNDVVDLRDAPDKTGDRRFLDRVFSSQEQVCIQEANNPFLVLWLLWSAKESLFKILRKMDSAAVFAHPAFRLNDSTYTQLKEISLLKGEITSETVLGNCRVQLRWEWNSAFVHCMASDGAPPGWVARVAALKEFRNGALSAREEESVHSEESRKVRRLAKLLLREVHGKRELEVVRMGEPSRLDPPVVWNDGKPLSGMDLSLSHDGAFVAAMVSR